MKVARSSMLRMPNFKPAKESEPKLAKIEALKGEYKTFMQSQEEIRAQQQQIRAIRM